MELNERCNALVVRRQVVPHSKGVERPHCCAISLPLSLDTSKHTPGSKRSHDPKAGLCRQPQECMLVLLSGHSRTRSQGAPSLALKSYGLARVAIKRGACPPAPPTPSDGSTLAGLPAL